MGHIAAFSFGQNEPKSNIVCVCVCVCVCIPFHDITLYILSYYFSVIPLYCSH